MTPSASIIHPSTRALAHAPHAKQQICWYSVAGGGGEVADASIDDENTGAMKENDYRVAMDALKELM